MDISSDENYDLILEAMKEAAYAAGQKAMASRKSGLQIITKPDGSVVSEMDIEIEEDYKAALRGRFGGAWMGEETEGHYIPAEFHPWLEWRVDPIDGTANYVAGALEGGFPSKSETCTSVALYNARSNEGIIGIVHNFVTGDMYVGIKDKGAWAIDRFGNHHMLTQVDNCSLAVPSEQHLSMNPRSVESKIPVMQAFENAVIGCGEKATTRCYGSSAMEMVHVACNSAKAFHGSLREWDYAAAAIIAREAGREVDVVRNHEGEKDLIIVSIGPDIHKDIIDALGITREVTLARLGISPTPPAGRQIA